MFLQSKIGLGQVTVVCQTSPPKCQDVPLSEVSHMTVNLAFVRRLGPQGPDRRARWEGVEAALVARQCVRGACRTLSPLRSASCRSDRVLSHHDRFCRECRRM